MLIPNRKNHRKFRRARGKNGGKAQRGNRVAFGSYGLKATTAGELSSRQIEAARQAISRAMKRAGKTWIRIFPHMPITRKAAEVPMGSGKGSIDFYVARVRPGTVLFEVEGVPESVAREAFRLAGHKLCVKVRFTTKEDV